ncbi:MAG TPA: transcriptional regulator GcvA [Burkholderiaceae bacterium]|nr:transcriptional regulator GcvA [Burkholderiaceae bacterium]
MRRLTHLNALRAFEAAARHASFAKAADELSVTPAAISQQIATLESYLGVQLFRRIARGVHLTAAAQQMLPPLREGFDLLAAAFARAQSGSTRRHLVVSLTPSVAAKWLMPRLERFITTHPEIDVRIDTTTRLVDFAHEEVDVALRYGSGRWPGLAVSLLMKETVFPVCSPRLLLSRRPLRTPHDLAHHTLIHDASMPARASFPQWTSWLQAAGVHGVDGQRGLQLDASMLAIQAAIDGQGVALGRSVLVADDVAAGRLVAPFALTFPSRFAYYIVYPRRPSAPAAVQAFARWARAEAASFTAAPSRSERTAKPARAGRKGLR